MKESRGEGGSSKRDTESSLLKLPLCSGIFTGKIMGGAIEAVFSDIFCAFFS